MLTHIIKYHYNLRQIPWDCLTTGKASLILDNVNLCLHPRAVDEPLTPNVLENMESAAQLAKQAIVRRAEEELYNIKGKNQRLSPIAKSRSVIHSSPEFPPSWIRNGQIMPLRGRGDRLFSRPLLRRCY